jgi:serine/threonine protein kinase
LDYGTDADGAYLVMEYLPNGTLKDRMDGAMPLAQAVGYLLPITEALTYLHERSLIHRDIKPANILFDENDHPMLADFGIIKLMEGGDGATLTATGASVGTPAYMAPELIGGEASAQTDQYALGVVLFELLTGKKPFEGRTPMETLTMQKYEPLPDPRRFKADLPEGVCEFLKRALAKPPEARYPSMAEFRAALVGLTESKPEPAPVAVVVNEDATQLEAGEEDETFNAVLKTSRTTLAEPRFQRLPKDAEARSSASERQGKALGSGRIVGETFPSGGW